MQNRNTHVHGIRTEVSEVHYNLTDQWVIIIITYVMTIHACMREQNSAMNHTKRCTVTSTWRSLSSSALATFSCSAGPLRQKDTLTVEGMYRGRLNVASMASGRCLSSPGQVSSRKRRAATQLQSGCLATCDIMTSFDGYRVPLLHIQLACFHTHTLNPCQTTATYTPRNAHQRYLSPMLHHNNICFHTSLRHLRCTPTYGHILLTTSIYYYMYYTHSCNPW